MFTQNPINRRRRADDRGELGARRGGRRRAGDPRHLPHRPRRRGARAHARAQEDRDPRRGRRRHRRGDGRGRAASSSSASTTISSRSSTRSPARCEEVYGPARDIEWAFAGGQLYLLQCRAVTRAGSSPAPRRWPAQRPVEVLERVPFFADLSRRDVEQHRAPVQGAALRRGRDGHQGGRGRRRVLRDRVGRGDRLGRRHGARATLGAGRLLRRDRADRRGRALGDDHRDDRPRLLRAHLLGVPAARAAERRRSAGSSSTTSPRSSARPSSSSLAGILSTLSTGLSPAGKAAFCREDMPECDEGPCVKRRP